MLIAIDIGNSSINIGYFTETGLFVQKMNASPRKSPSQYRLLFSRFMKEKNIDKRPEGSIISSVVSGHTMVFVKALKTLTSSDPFSMRVTISFSLLSNSACVAFGFWFSSISFNLKSYW